MGRTLQKLAKVARAVGDLRKPKELRAEEHRIRAFAKDVVWKYLEENTESVLDAQKLLKMTDHLMKTSCETMVIEYRQYVEKLDTKSIVIPAVMEKDYVKEREFLKLFENEKSAIAYDIIRQLNGAVQALVNKELNERELKSLPIKLLE
jgi:vacuolar-type H+-ATPase catalytic subunit A/Vma1